jgi:chromosome segregation ATPase
MNLLERMAELEIEQCDARTELSQLAKDKQQFESSLKQLRAETSAIKQIKTEQAALQARLVDAVEAKEREHQQLREQIEHSQEKAEQDITQLRIERDQALELTKTIANKNPVKLSNSSFRMRLLLIGMSLFSILLISLLIF